MELLADNILRWAQKNNWYLIDAETNQLRFERKFERIFRDIKTELEYQGKLQLKGQVDSSCGKVITRCRHIDIACRSGCKNESEMYELQFLRAKAMAAVYELAEVIKVLQNVSSDTSPELGTHNNTFQQWLTFAEAAAVLGVAKSTVSKWAAQNLIKDNGLKGQKRRLQYYSVLLLKHAREEKDLKRDVLDLRLDAARYKDF